MNTSSGILCLYDFTAASEKAFDTALVLAGQLHCGVTLFHVLTADEKGQQEQVKQSLEDIVKSKGATNASIEVFDGDLFDGVARCSRENRHSTVLFGTHGVRGLQNLFGAHSVKIVDNCHCPVYIIQQNTQWAVKVNTLLLNLNTVWDTAAIENYIQFATQIGANTIAQYISLMGDGTPDDVMAGADKLQAALTKNGLGFEWAREDKRHATSGLSRQIEELAVSRRADAIVISKNEYPLLGKALYDADRESIINNASGVPVMFF